MGALNEEKRLPRAIRSILDQTCRDFELLIVNDGSTDGTPRVLEEFAKQDGRVRWFQNASRQGLGGSLNRCAGEARGEFLARMDADDVSLPSRLEEQVCFLDAHPEVDIVGTAAYKVDDTGKITGTMSAEPDHDRMVRRIYRRNPFIHPSVMMRRVTFARLGGYDESLPLGCEDYDLWLRASRSCRFANLSKPLLMYTSPGVVNWARAANHSRAIFRSIRKERGPIRNYYYALRPILSVPLDCCRHIRLRLFGV